MLLFDLDGTLIDSNGVWVEVDRTFLARRGLEATPEYAHTVGHSIFPVAAQFTRDYYGLPDSAQDIMDEWLSLAGDAYSTRVPLKPGARAFLLRCRAAGEPMVLATACVPQLCRAALERHGLTEWFSAVFSAQELGLEKRDPALYREAARLCGQMPGDCVLFDDSPVYCAAAKEAGWQVFGAADPVFADRAEEMARICGPGRFPFDFSGPLPAWSTQ